jgi:LPXTG-site transpeptidase (sortase) family protein
LLGLIAVLYLFLLFYILDYFPIKSELGNKENPILGEAQKRKALPRHLMIPAINLSAQIQHVGVTANGEMGIPSNTVDVGWFSLGTRPGEQGSAVIAGHFNGVDGKQGVFADLNKLKEGDKLYIIDAGGKFTTFIVRLSKIYDPGYAEEEVFRSSTGAHLNLVTCDGFWEESSKSYTKRLVVFAEIAP